MRPRGSLARRRDESGAALVEFALVLPLLVMLIFGIVSAGLAYGDHLAMNNAVREGARLGSALDYESDPSGWATTVRDRVKQVYLNESAALTDADICVALQNDSGTTLASTTGSSCGTAPGSPTTVPAGTCVVKVWAEKARTIETVVFPDMNLHIGADSVSYYAREAGSCKTQ